MKLTEFKAVTKDAAAIRGTATLQPVGGKGDKVFPPTHMIDDKRQRDPGDRYAKETRRLGGTERKVVLLDSVQSQANRMEDALDKLWRREKLALPVVEVALGFPDLKSVTSLTAPHRIADALLRDSLLDGKLFRHSDIGKSFTDASIENAGPLFSVCPTALLFGVWDSTGPKGGLGFKLARNLTSEVVGIDVAFGAKTSSRVDPTNISKNAGTLYEAKDPEEDYTLDEGAARKEKGKPVLYGKKGSPAEANLGNIPPSVDETGGGVTFEYALQTVVLSLSGIRKLGFGDAAATEAAHSALAALGLVAVLAGKDAGYNFRSRCELCPEVGKALTLEVVGKDGSTAPLTLTLDEAISLLSDAVKALPPALGWKTAPGKPIAKLEPSPKLTALIQKTRELAQRGEVEDT